MPAIRGADRSGVGCTDFPRGQVWRQFRSRGTFTHDGVTLYYDVYGAGDPLLIVHFNGGSIADMGAQIDHFRKGYKVIAMDSRDHGKSSDSPDKLTYERMTTSWLRCWTT